MREKAFGIVAVMAAALGSLCCIGPILAAALGLGAFGAAAGFEAARPCLLAVAAAFLLAAFLQARRRASAAACGDGICASAERQNRRRRAALWAPAAAVAALAALPYAPGLGGRSAVSAAAGDAAAEAAFRVAGMTCASCAAGIAATLERSPGVLAAEVDPVRGSARIRFDPAATSEARLAKAIRELGYETTVEGVRP